MLNTFFVWLMLWGSLVPAYGSNITLIAEGVEWIAQNNIISAREQAIRNALADAARQQGAQIYHQSTTEKHVLTQHTTRIQAQAHVTRYRILDELNDNGLYRVRLEVTLATTTATNNCPQHYRKHLLVGNFPLQQPEWLGEHHMSGYARLSGLAISRIIGSNATVIASHNADLMLSRPLARTVTPPDWQRIHTLAKAQQAHYILSGEYTAVGQNNLRKPVIAITAQLWDAQHGRLIAQKDFKERLAADTALPNDTLRFGSPAHRRTPFGQAQYNTFKRIAQWSRRLVACQPLSAHVIAPPRQNPLASNQFFIDMGAKNGVRQNDIFSVVHRSQSTLDNLEGQALGHYRVFIGEAVIDTVFPAFSSAHMKDGIALPQPGDELYSD